MIRHLRKGSFPVLYCTLPLPFLSGESGTNGIAVPKNIYSKKNSELLSSGAKRENQGEKGD
jgi:hypothetical protein